MSQSRQSNEYRALSLRSSTLADLAASVNQTVEALLRSEVAQAKAAGKSCIEAFQQSEWFVAQPVSRGPTFEQAGEGCVSAER